jgi:ribose 5-phosphate isomerase A
LNQENFKSRAAQAALDFIEPGEILGVGTGSTVNFFIDALAKIKGKIEGVVSSSEASTERLRAIGLRVLDLNRTGDLSLYVDGADEATRHLHLIKGGGGALTREKIIASASRRFVCIVDESKLSPYLGSFPLPVEVIPMAQSLVASKLI